MKALPPDRATLAAVWNAHYSLEEIAARFRVSKTLIQRRAVEYSLGRKPRNPKNLIGTVTRYALADLWNDPQRSLQSIADHFGVSKGTISHRAAEYGLGPKPSQPRPGKPKHGGITRWALLSMWNDVHTLAYIADHFHVSQATVRQKAKEYGLGPKPEPSHDRDYRYRTPEEEKAKEEAKAAPPVDRERVRQLLAKGWSRRIVAKLLGTTRTAVGMAYPVWDQARDQKQFAGDAIDLKRPRNPVPELSQNLSQK